MSEISEYLSKIGKIGGQTRGQGQCQIRPERSLVSAPAELMARALRLAEAGRYTTHPNPRVGCVIVKDGLIVGEGAHLKAGEPHAEVFALRQAGSQAAGAEVFVTLEPCNHFGRTPPCVDALIAAGVSRAL